MVDKHARPGWLAGACFETRCFALLRGFFHWDWRATPPGPGRTAPLRKLLDDALFSGFSLALFSPLHGLFFFLFCFYLSFRSPAVRTFTNTYEELRVETCRESRCRSVLAGHRSALVCASAGCWCDLSDIRDRNSNDLRGRRPAWYVVVTTRTLPGEQKMV